MRNEASYKGGQEHMMIIAEDEEERINAKNSKQAESPAYTKNRTHLLTSSLIYTNSQCTVTLGYEHSKLTYQVLATQ